MMSSRLLRQSTGSTLRNAYAKRVFSTTSISSGTGWDRRAVWSAAGGAFAVTGYFLSSMISTDTLPTSLDAMISLPMPVSDVMKSTSIVHTSKEERTPGQLVEEPETGILFASTFDTKRLLGCGVRKKYSFVNVYAVGFYVDPDDFKSLTDETAYEEALLNPHNHRAIRIVMNRSLSMETIISALMEALEPRMHGQDLHTLEEFSKLKEHRGMQKGDEILLSIKGEDITTECSNGGSGFIQSEVFTRAVCDVYFGKNPISPHAKKSAMEGVHRL